VSTNFVKTTSGGATNASVPEYGTLLRGYAGFLSEVPVTGFPVFFTANAPNGGSADYVCIECIANSANIDGVVGPAFFLLPVILGSTTAPIPIILRNADYKPEILAADNLITDSAGLLYRVVGLYETVDEG
jgi:hypothetical protein